MMKNQRPRDFWGLDLSDLDEYGFTRAREHDNEEYQNFMTSYAQVLSKSLDKWSTLLMRPNSLKRSRKLKKYIRQGIPFQFRGLVWLAVSGADDVKSSLPEGFYNGLLKEEHSRALRGIVILDINRTYPDNIFFGGSSRIQFELYNVLVAYAHHNPILGYCQGFNYIAGLLILATRSEETTFWLLKILAENILPDYYCDTMEGVTVDIEVLSELIRMILPDVYSHMAFIGLPWAVVVTKWFVCLYADVLPAETVFRIWDCLFYEGSKILFRVAITLIKKYRNEILNTENVVQAAACFKKMTCDKSVLKCHEFMQSIFRDPGRLSNSTIQKLRQKVRKDMEKRRKEIEERMLAKRKSDKKGKNKSKNRNKSSRKD